MKVKLLVYQCLQQVPWPGVVAAGDVNVKDNLFSFVSKLDNKFQSLLESGWGVKVCWLAPLTQCHCPVHVHYGLDFHLPGAGVPCQEPWLSPCTYQVRATSSSHHVMVDILHSHCRIGHSFTIRVKKKPQVNILHEPVQRL